MARAQATTDHQVIRSWIEARDRHPFVVRATESRRKDSAGCLRVDFAEAEDSLDKISWGDIFDTFESNHLTCLFQDEAQDRFHKFVARDEDTDRASASDDKSRQVGPADEKEAEEIDEEYVDEDEDDDDDDEDDVDVDDDEDEDEDDDDDEEDDD